MSFRQQPFISHSSRSWDIQDLGARNSLPDVVYFLWLANGSFVPSSSNIAAILVISKTLTSEKNTVLYRVHSSYLIFQYISFSNIQHTLLTLLNFLFIFCNALVMTYLFSTPLNTTTYLSITFFLLLTKVVSFCCILHEDSFSNSTGLPHSFTLGRVCVLSLFPKIWLFTAFDLYSLLCPDWR